MKMPCTDPNCSEGKLTVIRSRHYPEASQTRRVYRCDRCGRLASSSEKLTNGNRASTYLPPAKKFSPSTC
jgi:transcriptional regulator NrdR family protein